MLKPVYCAVLFVLLLTVSCRQHQKTEIEDISYWKEQFIDSSFKLLFENADTVKALHFFDSSFNSHQEVSPYAEAARFDLLANYHYFISKDNQATAKMIDCALTFYRTKELQNRYPRTYVGLLLFGGHIAYRLTHYGKANEYYFRAKRIADAHLNACERTAFNYSIAMVLYRQQNFRASLNYFKEAYSLQETCSPQTTGVVLQQQEIQSNIGLCYVELKTYDSAMLHFDHSLRIAEQYKDSLGPAFMDKIHGVVYGNKVRVALARNLLNEAEQLSLKAIALNDRDGYEKEYAQSVKLLLAEVYQRKNDRVSMLEQLQSVDKNILASDPGIRKDWNYRMASYYEETSTPALAIPYLKTYFSLSDSINMQQKLLTAADINRKLKEQEQHLQISVLKKDKVMAIVWLWVTILFSCMALVMIYLFYQNYRRSKKSLALSSALNDEIQKQKEAREEEVRQRHKLITEAVICAQENERSLIGLELHDNINQVLTTVKLHNEMVLEGVADARDVLPRTLKYLQECITEIRSLSRRLSAPTLGKIGFEESIKDLLESINATSKVRISHKICCMKDQQLKKEVHLGLYRILQEQLNNVLKHSDASEVFVQLKRSDNHLNLLVSDNGKGFSVQNSNSGIGLMNMQTRAESLNGTLELVSQPGRGCQLKVAVPCNN